MPRNIGIPQTRLWFRRASKKLQCFDDFKWGKRLYSWPQGAPVGWSLHQGGRLVGCVWLQRRGVTGFSAFSSLLRRRSLALWLVPHQPRGTGQASWLPGSTGANLYEPRAPFFPFNFASLTYLVPFGATTSGTQELLLAPCSRNQSLQAQGPHGVSGRACFGQMQSKPLPAVFPVLTGWFDPERVAETNAGHGQLERGSQGALDVLWKGWPVLSSQSCGSVIISTSTFSISL